MVDFRKPGSQFGIFDYRDLMLSLMPLLNLVFCVVYAAALFRTVTAVIDAPIGYEDDEGFHYGLQPLRVRD